MSRFRGIFRPILLDEAWRDACDAVLPMASSNRFALSLLPVLFAAAASAACADSSSDSSGFAGSKSSGDSNNVGAAAPGQSSGNAGASNGSAERAVAEADVVQLEGGRLYAMSKSGSLSIIDVSRPGRLTMLGQAYLPGEPFEMYLRGDLLVVMTNGAYTVTGQPNEPPQSKGQGETRGSGAPASSTSAPSSPDAGAGVLVLNVKDPGLMQRVATFAVPGEIADSRIIGDILYLATYENAACYGCGSSPRTMVTSFDVSSPAAMRQVDHVAFESGSQYGSSWGSAGHKRSIVATNERLYIGGHGELAPSYGSGPAEGVIDVLDITDPSGKLGRGAHIETTGAILSRWQMDEKDGVLRVISQRGIGYTTNGVGSPEVQTFHIWNTRSFQAMGKTSLSLPRQEGLKSVRFDGERAYAITFEQTDPLFIIDSRERGGAEAARRAAHAGLGLPPRAARRSRPRARPGSHGPERPPQRVALRRRRHGQAQDARPSRVRFDRLQQRPEHRDVRDARGSGPHPEGVPHLRGRPRRRPVLRRLDLRERIDELRGARRRHPAHRLVAGLARQAGRCSRSPATRDRAIRNQGELLAVSDSNVTSFDIARRDVALKTADFVIGSCEARPIPTNNGFPTDGNEGFDVVYGEDDYDGHWHCAAAGAGVSARGSFWAGAALGLAVIGAAVRRRRQNG